MSGSDAFEAINSMLEFCKEVNSLVEDLRGNVIKEIENCKKFKPGAVREDDRLDEGTWLYTDCSFSIPLARMARGRSRTFAHLSFQISLVGDGAKVAGEPLLHIFLWSDEVSFDEEYYLRFPFENDEEEKVRNVKNRLVTWEVVGEKWFPFGWAYSVKLFAIKDKGAVKELIVDPVMKLLSIDPKELSRDEWEKKALEALPNSLLQKGVIEYQDEWFGIQSKK